MALGSLIEGKEHNSPTLFVLFELMTVTLGGAELKMQSQIFIYFFNGFVLTIGCLQAQPAEQSFHDCELTLPVEKRIFSQIVCLKNSQAALMNSEDHQHTLIHQNKSSKSQSRRGVKS